MPRFLSRLAPALLLGLLLPVRAFAQGGPAPDHPRHGHLRECLSILDLTDAQKADIQAILEAARPGLQAGREAVRAAREALRAAVETVPPDACLIGNDFLALTAARQAFGGSLEAVLGQIMATLTPDQQSMLEGCLQAPRPNAAGEGGGRDE